MEFSDGGALVTSVMERALCWLPSHMGPADPARGPAARRPSVARCVWEGAVPPVREPTQLCTGCEWRAYELSSDLECLDCRGRGVVTFVA